MKITLNGKWMFKATDDTKWMNATVPGCNFLDLMDNGIIEDPFLYTYEKDVQWVGKKDWEYKRSFTVDENLLEADDILLNADMLDTICDVTVNGKKVFSGDNCFVAYSVSIKDYIVPGENEIHILFHSPVNYVSAKYKECITPINSNGQNGIVHIRKPQCHFGWDWGPVLPASGITKDIEIEFVDKGRIDYLGVTQKLEGDTATITANVDITAYTDTECNITVIFPNGEKITKDGASATFTIENPELWWTKELSGSDNQPLYTVTAQLKIGNKMLDTAEKKIGIRTIELNRERDEYGRNFQFILNGVPIFIKGANYIPPDSFVTRFGEKELNYLLDAVQFSNMNMVRVWGGGYYESDSFYAECDKRGILVWQDFMFACQAYPFFNDDFLDNVKREVKYNVKRLSHHPSLAVWCGNNEIEDMHMAWVHMTKYVDWTETFFHNILGEEIRKYDDATPYTPGSPIGVSHNKGVGADNVGDTHLWGVWHGLQPMNYYRKRMTRFCSEFGFESLPDIKSIEKFAGKGEHSLNDNIFLAHQKCTGGNDKMVYYIATRFHLPKEFKDYVYLSQVTQLECIADATEHWRRNKGRCNGSMYWQFNDCWGVCSWSGIDYYGNYKALQYGARHFNEPLSVSIEDNENQINIYALNDLRETKDITCRYEIFDFSTGVIKTEEKQLNIGSVSNQLVFSLDAKELAKKYNKATTGVAAKLIADGKIIQQKTILPDKEKNLSLPKAKLKTKIEVNGHRLTLAVTSDKFARLVNVESSISSAPFSDNFFDILPGETKEITITDSSISGRELAESINVYSLCNINFDKNKLHSLAKQIKVYMSPTNIANAVHHGKLSTDVKFD